MIKIGTVSHGTMRDEDLIPEFLGILEREAPEMAAKLLIEYPDYEDAEEDDDFWTKAASDMTNDLFDALNDIAPPFCYFGGTDGDGSDYGFWVDSELFTQADYGDDVIKVADLSEVPDDATGYVLHVNDHGNCTLYEVQIPAKGKPGFRKASADLKEIWSIV